MPSCFHFGRGDGDTQQPEYNFLIECDLVHKHFVKYCKLNILKQCKGKGGGGMGNYELL
jgi:hypothetical protein